MSVGIRKFLECVQKETVPFKRCSPQSRSPRGPKWPTVQIPLATLPPDGGREERNKAYLKALGVRTNNLLDLLLMAEDEEGGHGADLVDLRSLRKLINIELVELHILELDRHLVDLGSDESAGTWKTTSVSSGA